jgi:hypothetical protein
MASPSSTDLNGIKPIAGLSRLAQHLRYLAWLVDPGFPREPFVVGAADRAVGTREEHRTASKFFPIRFYAGRNRAARLGAFDHDDAQMVFSLFSLPCRFAIGWIAFS